MIHFLNGYETGLRSCYGIMDDYGNLIPCQPETYRHLYSY